MRRTICIAISLSRMCIHISPKKRMCIHIYCVCTRGGIFSSRSIVENNNEYYTASFILLFFFNGTASFILTAPNTRKRSKDKTNRRRQEEKFLRVLVRVRYFCLNLQHLILFYPTPSYIQKTSQN